MIISYRQKILQYNKIFRKTIKLYRQAVSFLIKVCEKEYDNYKSLDSNEKNNYLEKLIHSTKNHEAIYDFDSLFYKFPCYLRRCALNEAIGIYSSYISNYNNWEKNKNGNPPKLRYNHNVMPVFYKDNMYKTTNDKYELEVKIFTTDWVYIKVRLRKSDVDYISKHYSDWKVCNPKLEVKGKCVYLRFSYEKDIPLSNKELKDQIVVGVDLNVSSNSAVLCAIDANGTVISRKFINCGKEKDHLNKAIKNKNKAIKKNQPLQKYIDEPNFINYNRTPKKWRMIDYANKELAISISRQIVAFAKSVNADAIILEHLDHSKKKRFLKEKLHLWNCKMVKNITSSLAHKNGIHVYTIYAGGTSKYAFDGSGLVYRHKNYSTCTFSTGKIYNCDLNASYNIASRYFIRELLKSPKGLDAKAKVPSASKRITCTLDTLINLNTVIKESMLS